jgi:hypothetical protein
MTAHVTVLQPWRSVETGLRIYSPIIGLATI